MLEEGFLIISKEFHQVQIMVIVWAHKILAYKKILRPSQWVPIRLFPYEMNHCVLLFFKILMFCVPCPLNILSLWSSDFKQFSNLFYKFNWVFDLFIPNTDLLAVQNMHRNSGQLWLIREKYHRTHPVGVTQVKIDSPNKNYARSAL